MTSQSTNCKSVSTHRTSKEHRNKLVALKRAEAQVVSKTWVCDSQDVFFTFLPSLRAVHEDLSVSVVVFSAGIGHFRTLAEQRRDSR